MTLAEVMLQALRAAFAGRPVPRIGALHLPPVPWTGTKSGEFGAIELEGGALGLSYLLLDDVLATIAEAGSAVVGADALQVAGWWAAGRGARSALGFAAVNALSRHLFDARGIVPPRAGDSIAGIEPQAGEAIGMVGFFPPLVKQVTARGARLTVLELRPDLQGDHGGFRVTADPRELAGCSQVLCTSTVLLNHTLDDVLAHCVAARRFVLLGPGAGCLPEVLFARGVTALAGTWVADAPAMTAALRSGAPWTGSSWKFLLERPLPPG